MVAIGAAPRLPELLESEFADLTDHLSGDAIEACATASRNMRDDHQIGWVNAVPNAVHHTALRAAAAMARALGDRSTADRHDRRADALREDFQRLLFDPEAGRYRDGLDRTGSPIDHHSFHSSVFALRMGLASERLRPGLVRAVADGGVRGNIFAGMFFFETLFSYSQGVRALEFITDAAAVGPARQLAQGATTTWEAWDKDLKWNTSLCHPAGSMVGSVIAQEVTYRCWGAVFCAKRQRPSSFSTSAPMVSAIRRKPRSVG
ncbi:alpha-L-rhamnosidase-related protein [Parenemella sanctibonifatiensis]|uniref:alpha-L-rhamnosidase n=1 Tax=Parenemella sanctibonifatiensis TaxID=2016505 RepID=A0A255ESW5_9ACTN|nr:family 78 glycoside hydrolase catalytic domain [Parenemella sanctibonifatiensis]OYN92695.1 hypothetical protein CGZ91_04295 [Parenemella sanctibonifatiensis]